MPIARAGSRLLFFAHTPKCGGSSVEAYLESRFGLLGFVDSDHVSRAEEDKWTRVSPQHLTVEALERLFPQGFFDFSFAVTRDPSSRFISAFKFQVMVEKSISKDMSIEDFIDQLISGGEDALRAFDNHFMPQTRLIPSDARVFRLEDGLEAIIEYVDTIAGDSNGPRSIGHVNRARQLDSTVKIDLTESFYQKIYLLYKEDYERFGYEVGGGLVSIKDIKAPGMGSKLLARLRSFLGK